jgi:hypothetical protein
VSEEQRDNSGACPPSLAPHRFQPGQSGNPGGRPKGRSITSLLRDVLERESEPGKTTAEVIAEVLATMARLGDIKAICEVLDRTEGKSVPAVTQTEDTKRHIVVDLEPIDPT